MIKLPADPSRHRVAVWREPRKIGALSLGQGIWAVPEAPVFADGVQRALDLIDSAGGQGVTLRASGRSPEDASRFREMFTAARSADWAEFLADCGKFEAEIDEEVRIAKFTLAELEEEKQSLERLRRWHRDLTARDVFGAPEAAEAGTRLKQCTAICEDYAERSSARCTRVTRTPCEPSACRPLLPRCGPCARCTRRGSPPPSARTASPPTSAASPRTPSPRCWSWTVCPPWTTAPKCC
ncbi:hypothetical protein GCM10009837_19950 [Streptomyces durmitorensis]